MIGRFRKSCFARYCTGKLSHYRGTSEGGIIA
jgi:hypothetical protein